jgi:ribokinase
VVIGGANAALTPAHITPQALADSSVFLSQFETPFETIRAVFSSPEAKAGITILNAAPAVDGGEALFPLADILVLNQTELARYAGGEEAATLETATVAARRLILRPDQRVVATLGAAGAAAVGPDSAFLVRGRAARVVDTSGAGDCFCGVLAAALAEGQDLRAAMTIANAAAALSTERHGAGLSAPTRAETEAALASA